MTILTEGQHSAEFIVSLANGNRSCDEETVASGQNLVAGAVVGKLTADGKIVEYDPGNADGSENVYGVLYEGTDGVLAADAQRTVVTRDAEVNRQEIVWFSGATGGQITAGEAELVALGIIPR